MAENSSVNIVFTGDILMHYAVKGTAQRHDPQNKNRYTVEGFTYLFEKTAPILTSADFAIGNMEFPVSPPFVQNEFIFNCPPQILPAFKKSGFDAFSISNNHIVDQGIKGAIDTMDFLEHEKLLYFGVSRSKKQARRGIILEKNGIKVGLISHTGLLNYPFPPKGSKIFINSLNDKKAVMADIADLKKRCDYLVVQPHAGVEYTLTPTNEQQILYREFIEAGADIVIGHHPHTLQYAEGVTTSKGRYAIIIYSLGNFICNQDYSYPIEGTNERLDIRNSVIINLKLNKNGSAISQAVTAIPVNTSHKYTTINGVYAKDIRTLVIEDELSDLKTRLETSKDRISVEKQITILNTYKSAIQKTLFKKGRVKDMTISGIEP